MNIETFKTIVNEHTSLERSRYYIGMDVYGERHYLHPSDTLSCAIMSIYGFESYALQQKIEELAGWVTPIYKTQDREYIERVVRRICMQVGVIDGLFHLMVDTIQA